MKNFIAIDPSEDSTAVYIKSNKGNFLFNYTTNKPDYKWNKLTNQIINFRFYNYEKSDDYSENEILNLKMFIKISNDLLKDILENIDMKEESLIIIEGFNYSKFSGSSIIDLVSVSTCIRSKILENIKNIKLIKVIAPKSLKSKICEMVYGFPEPTIGKKGKPLKEKLVAKNKEGMSGGDFTKREMFISMIDGEIKSPFYNWCFENKSEILSYKKIQKPMEDIVDSILLLKVIETYDN
jgi:hypothetical protein